MFLVWVSYYVRPHGDCPAARSASKHRLGVHRLRVRYCGKDRQTIWADKVCPHFFATVVKLAQGLRPVFRPDMTKGRAAEVEGRLSYFFIAAKGLSDGNNLQHNTWRVFTETAIALRVCQNANFDAHAKVRQNG